MAIKCTTNLKTQQLTFDTVMRYEGDDDGVIVFERSASNFCDLCSFMQCINVHKIYQMGPDPTDKFFNFMHVYACIKIIRVGPAVYAKFMQSHKCA